MRAVLPIRSARTAALLSLAAVTVAGLTAKFYAGPLRHWLNDYGAGVFYEIFWILLAFGLRPSPTVARRAPVWVLAITVALEFLQLWHPPFLEMVRSAFVGRSLIGTTFSWWDFPHYLIGCWIGWRWAEVLLQWSKVNAAKSQPKQGGQ